MNKLILPLLFTISTVTISLHSKLHSSDNQDESADFFRLKAEHAKNGKTKNAKHQEETFLKQEIPANEFPQINALGRDIIAQQQKVLRYKGKAKYQLGNLEISKTDLENTIDILLSNTSDQFPDMLDAYKIKGADNEGHVLFTGYYTPILNVSKTKTKTYKYPIYAFPKDWDGKLPSRKGIDGKKKVLANKGLELAYAKNLMDIYIMQVQGSGIVEYRNGKQELFAFSASNRRPYRSIGKYMKRKGYVKHSPSLRKIKKYIADHPEQAEEILFKNSSYVFFEPQNTKPTGAANVPLTSMRSIAVDPNYIPLGSILVATIPIVDGNNKVIRHDIELLVAQDIGGAIKGSGHVDLYTGIGEKAHKKARQLHHYGNIWILLPKELQKHPLA